MRARVARELQQQRSRLMRFWHYFKRRALDQRIAAATRCARRSGWPCSATARAAAEELEKETPPEFPGLSVEARRAINLAAIACAEVLCARLVEDAARAARA